MRDLTEAFDVLAASTSGRAVVEVAGTPFRLEFVVDRELGTPPRAMVEVVAVGDEVLDAEQEAVLGRLGWSAPGTPCAPSERCWRAHPDWYRFESLDASPAVRRPLLASVVAALAVVGADGRSRCTVAYTTSEGSRVSLR